MGMARPGFWSPTIVKSCKVVVADGLAEKTAIRDYPRRSKVVLGQGVEPPRPAALAAEVFPFAPKVLDAQRHVPERDVPQAGRHVLRTNIGSGGLGAVAPDQRLRPRRLGHPFLGE